VLTIPKRFSLSLLGPFRLTDRDGVPLTISSKKGVALIAMLAMSPNGERARAWLQERLWGSRGKVQARASIRRELSNLRFALRDAFEDLLQVDSGRVRLRLETINIDVVRLQPDGWAPTAPTSPDSEFLEGLDIRGEEGFEAWVKLVRKALDDAQQPRSFADDPKSLRPTPPAQPVSSGEPDATVKVWLPPVDDSTSHAPSSAVARSTAREIVGLLARVRWLQVVAGAELRAVGAGPTLIVEREIVESEAGESVEVRLLRAPTRQLIWSERLPSQGATGSPRASVRLTAQLVSRIEREEQARASLENASDDDFRALIWRGRWRLNRLTRADAAQAERLIARAVAIAPRSSEAVIQKAVAFAWEKWAQRAPRADFWALANLARQVMLLDPDDSRGYWLAGVAETWLGNSNTAVAWLRRAIDIEPTFEAAHAQLGSTLNLADRPQDALDALSIALGLSPNDTHLFFRYSECALSLLLLGRFEESVAQAERALLLRPGYWFAQTIRLHAYTQLGRPDEARRAAVELRRLHPDFSEDYLTWVPFVDRAWPRRLWASVHAALLGSGRDPDRE
jgi:tetratricopeptide (TPR) repeat protein